MCGILSVLMLNIETSQKGTSQECIVFPVEFSIEIIIPRIICDNITITYQETKKLEQQLKRKRKFVENEIRSFCKQIIQLNCIRNTIPFPSSSIPETAHKKGSRNYDLIANEREGTVRPLDLQLTVRES